MKLYRHTFYVQGSGLFPIDMLRYDRCSPETEEDSHAIERHRTCEPDANPSVAVVSLRTDPKWLPTVPRWKSFGWTVMDTRQVVQVGYA